MIVIEEWSVYMYLFCLCMCCTIHNTCRPSLRTVNQWLSWLQMNALWSLILIQKRSLCSVLLSVSRHPVLPPSHPLSYSPSLSSPSPLPLPSLTPILPLSPSFPHTFAHTGLASTSLLLGDVSGIIERSQTSRARLIT